MKPLWAILSAAAVCVAPAWGRTGRVFAAAGDSLPKSIVVFAAASAANALDEIKSPFAAETGAEVQTSYSSSATLAQQIVHGADADVFISADTQWADYLAKQGLIAQRRDLLGNRLVIVVPDNSKLSVRKPEDLTAGAIEHLALADPDGVPAGRYAKQALMKLGLWEQLRGKVAAAEDVRHALAYVETGAAEAGIVYATDAAISKKVRVAAEIPEKLSEPIRYPVLLLRHGQGRPLAESFFKRLASPEAAKIFKKYGFSILSESDSGSGPYPND